MFLRNYWYAAGFSEEVGREFLARTYLDENVVIFRREDGTPVALEDRCAHRRLPLSMGKLIGDTVECGYHGLLYDCAGTCIKIPGQDRVPKGTGVKAYPIVERHRYLWIWMGDPKLADESEIPDFSRIDDPAYGTSNIKFRHDAHVQLLIDNLMDLSHLAYVHSTTTGSPQIAELADPAKPDESKIPTHFNLLDEDGWTSSLVYRPVRGHYELINDNLLDLSHLATVHASTVGTGHVADFADVETEHEGQHVKVSRWTMDVPAATTYQQFGSYDGNIDRWQVSENFPPSYFRINNGAAAVDTGAREGKGEKRWDFWVSHGITPESETSTHYFWALAHRTWTNNPDDIEEFHHQCHHVVGEDLAVFEAQQACIDLDPSAPTLDIRYDAGPMMARRIIGELLAEEASS